MVTVIFLFLFTGALCYTLLPVMGQRVDWFDEESWYDERRKALETEKRIYLKALKDIEFERASGKINDEDFEDLRVYYRRKVSEVLAGIQALGEDEDLEDDYEVSEYEEDDEAWEDDEDSGDEDEEDLDEDEDWDEDDDEEDDWDDDDDEEYEEYDATPLKRNRRENAFLGFFWFVLVIMAFLIVLAVGRGFRDSKVQTAAQDFMPKVTILNS